MKILVIVASGLHLGYIGCYGNEWVETPALDRLGAEGIVFDQHYADQPDTAGAQRAWQTGCYRFPVVPAEEELPSEAAADLFSQLAEQRIATCLVRNDRDRLLSSEAAGWQHIHLLESAPGEAALPAQMRPALVKALGHLSPSMQWLLRIDLNALLPPWSAPDEFRQRYTSAVQEENHEALSPVAGRAAPPVDDLTESEDRACLELQGRYAAAMTYVDTGVGQILHELEQRGLLEDMLVLVTTDCGQSLGEDTMRPGSRLMLHEERFHIPLIMRLPGKAHAGQRINLLTQSVDLLPTLFDAFGLPLPAVHGHSLLPLAKSASNPVRPYACAGLAPGDRVEWALRSPDWLFLLPAWSSIGLPTEPELYVKPDDRWEVNNIRQHHLELAERLDQTLRGFIEATRHPGPLRPPELPGPELAPAQDKDQAANSTARSTPP
jgi:arylsulfatase A-like enzyme